MPTASGLIPMKYEYFFNRYCALVLVYAEGDLAKPKGRYVFIDVANYQKHFLPSGPTQGTQFVKQYGKNLGISNW